MHLFSGAWGRATGWFIQLSEPRQYCTRGGSILSCHGMLAKAGVRTGHFHLATYCSTKRTWVNVSLLTRMQRNFKTSSSSLYVSKYTIKLWFSFNKTIKWSQQIIWWSPSPWWLLYVVAEVKVGHLYNPVSSINTTLSALLHFPALRLHHLQLLALSPVPRGCNPGEQHWSAPTIQLVQAHVNDEMCTK